MGKMNKPISYKAQMACHTLNKYEIPTIKKNETGRRIKKMETNELEIGIGTKEIENLKPATVRIVNVNIEEVGKKGNKKLVCSCKHPDREEEINLSAVKYNQKDKLVTSGLWLNKDEDDLIRKGSALANFMENVSVTTLLELVTKEVPTTTDEKGYLCFKAY